MWKHIFFIFKKSRLESLIGFIDLTTLSGDDTRHKVHSIVDKAVHSSKKVYLFIVF